MAEIIDISSLFNSDDILKLRFLSSPRETVKDRPLTREEAERSDLVYTIARLTEAIITRDREHASFCIREACRIVQDR